MTGPIKPVSLSAYARHRGVSLTLVRLAIKKGRLHRSLVAVPGVGMQIADVAAADAEWTANTNHTTTPAAVREHLENPQFAKPLTNTGPATAQVTPRVPRVRTGDEDEIPEVSDSMTLNEASVIEKRWRAKLVQLEFRKKAGELVEAKDVEHAWVGLVTAARAKLLGVPTRVRQKLPHLKPDEILIVDEFIREALEELTKREEEDESAE